VILLDSLLAGGLRFVLDKVAQAVDAEMNDEEALRERLLDAQMRLELGDIDPEAFADLEADLFARMRAIREARSGSSGPVIGVAGAEVRARLGHDEEA
jgi:hypothetical protein